MRGGSVARDALRLNDGSDLSIKLSMSCVRHGPPVGLWEDREMVVLEDAIFKAPPLVPEPTEEFPEDFPNDEHVRMLQVVAVVLAEAKRLGQPFEGDVDT